MAPSIGSLTRITIRDRQGITERRPDVRFCGAVLQLTKGFEAGSELTGSLPSMHGSLTQPAPLLSYCGPLSFTLAHEDCDGGTEFYRSTLSYKQIN